MSQVAPFPDQKYINHVRDALSSRENRASVMVGGGFSKFAVPVGPGVGELPLWDELATEMQKELGSPRPHRYGRSGQDGLADSDSPVTSAQDYEDAFGRSGLHLFLQKQVRDGDFKPGKFHTRLLKLPWRDIFTTNWDTLLERTRPQVSERPYSVVHNKDEIPLSAQPRIFKLHGSLDGHYPLIATKNDYDDYPKYQAPFVNTVQQAMMETVLCLIGFSGRDPNFVRWSSWVQENLGGVAPRIFIVGWLDLSDDERGRLHNNNVTAIDLARHPQACRWPPHLHHKNAADWILHTLENGRKYDVTQWPSLEDKAAEQSDPHLQPVEVVSSDQPKKEPTSPSISDDPQEIENSVHEVIPIWAHNRRLYPGWLMAPLEVRHTLISTIDEWQLPILKVLDSLSPVTQLNALRELMWLSEITLEPISPELESAALGSLALIDCEAQTAKGDLEPDLSWSEVREAWRETALTLLTAARFQLDQESFLARIVMLRPFLNDDPNVEHRVNHEKSLWAAFSLDFETLDCRLTHWDTRDCDPIWMLRKAALLSEAGREQESQVLTQQAMQEIWGIPDDDQSVAGPSREGWALWSTIDNENRQEVFNRWSHLAPRRCDAYAEKAEISSSLTTKSRKSEPPDFEHDTRHSTSIRFGTGRTFQFRRAYRAIRLSEIAGIPTATPHASPGRANAADLLEQAADLLVKSDAELAARLVLRACTYDRDKALMRVLSRLSIALMPAEAIGRLVADCTRLIGYSLPRGWIEHIRVAIEVLSWFAYRLDPDSALEIFDYSMTLYRDRQHPFASHAWISSPLQNLLSRAWTALSREQQAGRALELLAAPIVGLEDFDVQFPDEHPDAGELVTRYSDTPLPKRNAESEPQWQDVIRGLICALGVEGTPRNRATRRLLPLAEKGILTASEESDFASALWDKSKTTADGLPGGTHLHDWALLLLPEPKPGLVAKRFLGKWLSGRSVESRLDLIRSGDTLSVSIGSQQTDPNRLEDTLWNLGTAINGLKQQGRSLDLPDAEGQHLANLVAQWSTVSFHQFPHPAIQVEVRGWTLWALQGIGPILSEVEISRPVGETLFEKIRTLSESGIPAYDLIGALVDLIPERVGELTTWLRTGLASDDRDLSTGAVSGLGTWLSLSDAPGSSIQSPPAEVIRELGIIIGARRRAPLSGALQVAKWVFDRGSDDLRGIVLELTLQGLGHLTEELRYDRDVVNEDVPNLRLRCAELASSMAKAGLEETPAVARWLELASKDPFADVRHAVVDNPAR